MLNRRLIYLLLLLHPIIVLSQETQVGLPVISSAKIVPKSPQADALIRVGELTVNAARGVPDISFNLYTATVGNLKIPITLRYDATGIRYDDVPSAVGLKWSLTTGGEVSRNINGRPDEYEYFTTTSAYKFSDFVTMNNATSTVQTLLGSIYTNGYDVTQDQYAYNYLDKSGYFFYKKPQVL